MSRLNQVSTERVSRKFVQGVTRKREEISRIGEQRPG